MTLDIIPGARSQIGSISIALEGDGRDDPRLDDIAHSLAVVTGAPLNHGLYEQAKQQLTRRLRDFGYWHAHWIEHRLQINPEQAQASIYFILNTGAQSYFGPLEITSTPLDSDLIKRLADLPIDSSYDKPRLDEAYQRLQESSYFDSVWLQPQFHDSPLTATTVELEMARRYQFSTGIGYSSDQGPRISGRLEDRYVNRYGHNWKIDALWSGDIGETNAVYRVPLHAPAEQWLDNQLGYYRESTDSYDSETYSTGVRFVEKLNDRWNWFAATSFQHDIYQLNQQEQDTSNLLIPSLGLNYLVLNNPSRPTRAKTGK